MPSQREQFGIKIADMSEASSGIEEKIRTDFHCPFNISQTPFSLSSIDLKAEQYSIWRLANSAINPEYSNPKIRKSGLEKSMRQSENAM